MNVYKIYGNYSKREFLVSARDQWDAIGLVYDLLIKEGYSEEEIDEMEFQSNQDFWFDASGENIYELS